MDIAYASNGEVGGMIASFIPLLLMGCIFGALLKSLAKRKGRNQWLWFIAGFAPAIWVIGGIWLASLPDKSIVDEINFLKKKLDNLSSNNEKTWNCDCGNLNNASEASCTKCGRKHDYFISKNIAS